MTRHRFPALLATATLALGLAACGDDDDESGSAATQAPAATTAAAGGDTTAPAGSTPEIHIAGAGFGDPITVPAGTTVTVFNDSEAQHTLTADDGSFDTEVIAPGSSKTITLSTAGTFTFHCEIHTMMTGSITVTA